DLIGFKHLMVAGASLFGLASLAAGFSTGGAFLIAARVCQGLGAALIFPATIAMIMIVFPKDERGRAIGILAAIGTVFLAVGPMVGGFFTELVSWRWIFWVNVPIVALIIWIVLTAWIDRSQKPSSGPFDYLGLITLVVGLAMVVFAVMQSSDWGWTHGLTLGFLVAGLMILGWFVGIEARRESPLLDIELFRSASFAACNFVIFAGQFAKITIVVIGALYLQEKLGMAPLTAGFALLVAVAPFPVLSARVGGLADSYGARRLVLGGLSLATLSMGWIGLAATWQSYAALVPGLLLWGVGMTGCYAPALRAMANAVPHEKQGQTSGIGITSRMLGGTVGMAICSSLLVTSGSFQLIFIVTAATMLAALIFGWFAIERQDGEAIHHHPSTA
ncbi:MAG: MFS transporter, partial [Pseudomonadota bacterium]